MRHLLVFFAVALCQTLVADTDANAIISEFVGIDVSEIRTNQTQRVALKDPVGAFSRAIIRRPRMAGDWFVYCPADYSEKMSLSQLVSEMESLVSDVCKRFDCKLVDKNTNESNRVCWTFKITKHPDWKVGLDAMQQDMRGRRPNKSYAGLKLYKDNYTMEPGTDIKVSSAATSSICPGSSLTIQVGAARGMQPTVMNVKVDANGNVMLPFLLRESIACGGLSCEAFKQKLIRAYSRYIRQPMVTVKLASGDEETGK